MWKVSEQVQDFEFRIEEYVGRQIGIATAAKRNIDQYLSMERSEVAALSVDALREIVYELNAYAYYLQTEYNKQFAKAEKCKAEINKLIGPVIHHYDNIYGNHLKIAAAIADNSAATKWDTYEIECRGALNRMSKLIDRIEHVAKSLSDMAYTKQR